ncbi:MAG: hypothetical protein IJN43_10890 [Ruminococcus sp.]|nr:hypothetical protein [Ruminococcus sp.]
MTKFFLIVLFFAIYILVWYLLVLKFDPHNNTKEPESTEKEVVQNEIIVTQKNTRNDYVIKSKSYSKTEIHKVLIYVNTVFIVITIITGSIVGYRNKENFRKSIQPSIESLLVNMEAQFNFNITYSGHATSLYENDIDFEIVIGDKTYILKERWHIYGNDKRNNKIEFTNQIMSQNKEWILDMVIVFVTGVSIIFCLSFIAWKILSNMRKNKLKITDEHIIATGDKERTTILPYENIFSVSEGGIKGITLYTSIGKVTFHLIKNRNEIIKAVSQKIKHDKSVNIQ